MQTPSDAEKLKEKMQLWAMCFSEDAPNSIAQQLWGMTWDHAVYRLILKARERAPSAEDGLPPLVAQFIDGNFWNSQILATRRLIDGASLHGYKGVYSLQSLLDDLQQNRHLLTRENFFFAEGKLYDIEEAARRTDALYAETRVTGEVCCVPSEITPRCIARLHEKIDALACVRPSDRTPADTVRIEVLEGLERKMKAACDRIVLVANKFVGHAATPKSRIRADAIELDLQDLTDSFRALCRSARFLSWLLFSKGLFMNPIGSDHPLLFAHLDKPLAAPEDVEFLHDAWRAFFKDVDDWEAWSVAELCGHAQEKRA